ncbi:hypothetical protein HanIR_Chr17g0873551 [Helianthus annuus]|nr:hypothetical protein HanIR_Chr17g0873551 [Helianthus annuus]
MIYYFPIIFIVLERILSSTCFSVGTFPLEMSFSLHRKQVTLDLSKPKVETLASRKSSLPVICLNFSALLNTLTKHHLISINSISLASI